MYVYPILIFLSILTLIFIFFLIFLIDNTPYGVEHYTLWSRHNLTHSEICYYVDNWIDKRMPYVRRWNYDDNEGEKSIELFHVHVYIERIPYIYQPIETEKKNNDVSDSIEKIEQSEQLEKDTNNLG